MKKWEKALPIVLCILYILPVCLAVTGLEASLVGNIGKLIPMSSFHIVTTALATYAVTVITVRNRRKITTLPFAIYFVAFALSVVFVLYYSLFNSVDSVVLLIFALSVFLCCFISCTVILANRASRFIFAVLSSVPMIIISVSVVAISFMSILLADFGKNTVVGNYDSPEGTYRLEVIDVDQGALGGDTAVLLYREDPLLNLGIVKITKKPRTLYVGDWGEYRSMGISWVDDDTVIIKGEKYELE